VMLQLTKTCSHPKRFAIDVYKNRILLESWKSAHASRTATMADIVRSGNVLLDRKKKPKSKKYVTVDAFPHVATQDLRHVNEVLNTLCSNYLFMTHFDINIVLQNNTVVVKAKFKDVIDISDLVQTMRDWVIVVYDIVLDFPNNSVDIYLKTSDAESSHLAYKRP